MTFLYSCRHDGNQYRITKLDDDLNVESSYLCDLAPAACQCPAFERRNRCRHIEMLPKFIARRAIDTGWMFDFDRGGWVDNRTGDELAAPLAEEGGIESEELPPPLSEGGFSYEMQQALEADGEKLRQLTGEDHGPIFPLPEGVQESAPPAPAETKPRKGFRRF